MAKRTPRYLHLAAQLLRKAAELGIAVDTTIGFLMSWYAHRRRGEDATGDYTCILTPAASSGHPPQVPAGASACAGDSELTISLGNRPADRRTWDGDWHARRPPQEVWVAGGRRSVSGGGFWVVQIRCGNRGGESVDR